ncbi:MAG: hypothetical protein ACTSP3_11115, partial [Candidatus Heimdallarchaeaceae archaeon]
MLISILRNLGLATIGELGELEVILEEQANRLRNVKKVINCKVDFQSNSFDFETVDFSREKISKFLPGLQSKSSTNLSPFIS